MHQLTTRSHAFKWSSLRRRPWRTWTAISSADSRSDRTDGTTGDETARHSDFVGRRRQHVLPSRSEGCMCCQERWCVYCRWQCHDWTWSIEGARLTFEPDNHMINGTKLLNVAGMTRGRRDGILKSEKTRHVVKIGPMHLKGVWYGTRNPNRSYVADFVQDSF